MRRVRRAGSQRRRGNRWYGACSMVWFMVWVAVRVDSLAVGYGALRSGNSGFEVGGLCSDFFFYFGWWWGGETTDWGMVSVQYGEVWCLIASIMNSQQRVFPPILPSRNSHTVSQFNPFPSLRPRPVLRLPLRAAISVTSQRFRYVAGMHSRPDLPPATMKQGSIALRTDTRAS